MKGFKKVFLLLLTLSLVTGCLYSTGWAGDDKWAKNDPVGQGWSAMDLLVARPIGVAAGIVGNCRLYRLTAFYHSFWRGE